MSYGLQESALAAYYPFAEIQTAMAVVALGEAHQDDVLHIPVYPAEGQMVIAGSEQP